MLAVVVVELFLPTIVGEPGPPMLILKRFCFPLPTFISEKTELVFVTVTSYLQK